MKIPLLSAGLLENVLQKQKHSVTATPPPSPTHGQPNSASPVHTGESVIVSRTWPQYIT